jgi:type III secretion apparatus needle protein
MTKTAPASPLSNVRANHNRDAKVLSRRPSPAFCCTIAAVFIVALSGVAACITAGQSTARTRTAAQAAQSVSMPSALFTNESPEHVTPQQIANARAEYAKLKARVKQQIQQLKTRYAKVLSELNTEPTNPARILQLQAAMSEYETTIETDSQIISGWAGMIKQILRNVH